jgi:hypothetical protein
MSVISDHLRVYRLSKRIVLFVRIMRMLHDCPWLWYVVPAVRLFKESDNATYAG